MKWAGLAVLGILLAGTNALAVGPENKLSELLGAPYRNDGALDGNGRYTLFADQTRTFPSAGLNCSGFVVEAARRLFGKPVILSDAIRDRLGDSGTGAAFGRDWDFGWDLIMNVSEGMPRRMLLPGGGSIDPMETNGREPRGYDLHADETWTELLERVREGHVYLLSFNRVNRGGVIRHYHVGLLYPDANGAVWFYQTTPESGRVTRRDLADLKMRSKTLRGFSNTGKVRKKMVVIEVVLP